MTEANTTSKLDFNMLEFLLFAVITAAVIGVIVGIIQGIKTGKSTAGKFFFSILWVAGILAAIAAVGFGACVCIFSNIKF